MAAPARYVAPHKQLGSLMVRARRRGISFEEFWQEAVRPGETLVMVTTANPPAGAVRWPTDRNDRVTWQHAIKGAKDGWRRAYEREAPAPAELALRALADSLDLLADGFEARGELPFAA